MALQTATATFNGSQDTVAVSWTAPAGSYVVLPGNPTITDGSGPVVTYLTGVSSTGATVNTSDRFSGTVVVVVVDVP